MAYALGRFHEVIDLLLGRVDHVDRSLGDDDDHIVFGGERQETAVVVEHIDDAFLRVQEEITPQNRVVTHGDLDLGQELLFDQTR